MCVRHHFGAVRNYAFTPKPHDDLGGALGYMDFEAAAKLSGARFVVLKKGLARLERAIGQFMLDLHTNEHGYTEINPPLLVRNDVMFGTGQLPKFEDDQFWAIKGELLAAVDHELLMVLTRMAYAGLLDRLRSERLGLIPTAEVSLTNLVRESILDEKELPMRLDRADAVLPRRSGRGGPRHPRHDPPASIHKGRTGLDHDAGDQHGRARAHAVLRRGSAAAARSALPRDDAVRRRHGLFRAEDLRHRGLDAGAGRGRRLPRNLELLGVRRFPGAAHGRALSRGPDGKPRFVHTLNGSGTAVGRALIAVMETYQQEDGSIAVPDVLQPYMGGLKVIERDK